MQDFTERNTRNAQHSTGPTSQEGRDRSSQNSRAHGLYARIPQSQDELIEAYTAHKLPLMARLKPEDPLQECLAKIVVDALWRVECYRKSEAQPNLDSHPERESRGRQEQRVMNSMYKALKTLEEMQAQSKLARPAQEDARIDTEKEEKIKTAAALLESKDEEIAQLKARLETIGSLKEDSLKAERLKDQSAGFVSHPSQFHPSASPAGGVPPTGTAAQPAEMEENRAA